MAYVSWFFSLNMLTTKEKFTIPFNKDLLDEPHSAKFFTKMDIHLRYHQKQMKELEIHMINFYKDEGNYEFLVTTFEFCNASSTF